MGIRTRRAHKHSKTHIVGFGIAGAIGFVALLIVALSLSMGAVISGWLEDLPDYTSSDAYLVAEPTRVYDADGNEIAAYYLQNRRSVTLDDISDYVLKGTVDTEDKRFYEHNGVDPQGILRAVVGQVSGNDAGGGSTITQQLVRNTVLVDEQFEYSLRRKVREAYIAIKMEEQYTKDQILNMYLNTIFYGNGAYGIEAASITYFNKSASELTLAEAATLVGLPNAPSYYDPFNNPERCVERRNLVLYRMYEAGDITQEEYEAACAEELVLNSGELTNSTGTYPYFTDYVKSILLQDFSSDVINQGGLKVYTTLTPSYQDSAQQVLDEHFEDQTDSNMASCIVTVDNETGYILAMANSTEYGNDKDAGQVAMNMATTAHLPGSSFKTYVLVAALNEGMSPDVIINCNSPIQITAEFESSNNDNAQYGYCTLERATWLSSNTGYCQVAMAIGLDKVADMAHTMGISTELHEDYPVLAIGGSDAVSPLEMAEGYMTLATGGIHRDTVAITKITDRNDNDVYEHKDSSERVLDEALAEAATNVLEGVVKSGMTGRYVYNTYNADQPIAGKTGTSSNSDNLWFCGFSPQYTTVVWTGNLNTNKEIYYNGAIATTGTTSQVIWAKYMNVILDGLEREEFPTSTHELTYKDNSEWEFVGTSASANASYSYNYYDYDYTDSTSTTTEDTQTQTTSEPTVNTTTTTTTTPTTPTTPTTTTTTTDSTTTTTPTTPTTTNTTTPTTTTTDTGGATTTTQ